MKGRPGIDDSLILGAPSDVPVGGILADLECWGRDALPARALRLLADGYRHREAVASIAPLVINQFMGRSSH